MLRIQKVSAAHILSAITVIDQITGVAGLGPQGRHFWPSVAADATGNP
jgi:hypothetical protein